MNHWLGKKFSEEHRRKLSESHKGKKLSEEHRRKIGESNKGKKHPHSEETKKQISEIKKANPTRPWLGKTFSEEHRRKISESKKGISIKHSGQWGNRPAWNIGIKKTDEEREFFCQAVKKSPKKYCGERHWNWHNANRSGWYKTDVSLWKLKRWKKLVKERDNYTCQICGISKCQGRRICAHHIKPFDEYEELKYDINNGQTLCNVCHIKLHKNGGVPSIRV